MTSLAPTPSSLSTRPATATDIATLRSLAERTWRVSYAEMLSAAQLDYMLAWMYSPEQIAREMGEGVLWELAFVQKMAVGFFSLACEPDGRAKLNKLYVLPEQQGRGFGRALLERAENAAIARGAHGIWLQVNKHNDRARRTYERAGYHIERSAVFEIGEGFVMDDYLMSRELAPQPAA